jgi:excisionase family DNA binding protein
VNTSILKKLDTAEAAEYLGLGKSTLDKLRVTGGGPAFFKVGARVVYDSADLDAWIAQHRRSSTSQNTATAAA